MTKSDYVIKMFSNFIIVYDLNLGRMSVTNDIENIIKKLDNDYELNLLSYDIRSKHIVLCRDSLGEYARVVKLSSKLSFDSDGVELYKGIVTDYLDELIK